MGAFARRLRKAGVITGAGLLVAGLAAAPATGATARSVDASGFGSGSSSATVNGSGGNGSGSNGSGGYGYGGYGSAGNGYGYGYGGYSYGGYGSGNGGSGTTGGSGNGYGGNGYGSNGYGGNGYGSNGYGSQGGGGTYSGNGSTTPNLPAATTAESKGVVLIDTQIYDGSEAAGTGIILTSGGKILTNYHVVEGSTAIQVTIATSGKTYTASVVGADKTSDVAVLQLKNAKGLSTATLDRNAVSVGNAVTAVGNAGGTGTLSAASGSVTALNAKITTEAEDAVSSETLNSLIETNADVVPGDSGGPLLDTQGEVVGIDTAASSGSATNGYTIPIANALKIVNQISSGNETSQVRIGPAAYLGVEVTDSSATSEQSPYGNGYGQFGNGDQGGSGLSGSLNGTETPAVSGAAVMGVENGTPAATAGLAEGDVITHVGSTTINSASGLTSVLSSYQPGAHVKITWTNPSGSQQSATVTLGSSPIN